MSTLNDIPDDHPHYRRASYDSPTDSESTDYYNYNGFYQVLKYYLADIHRTWELGEFVRQPVFPKDITTTEL